MLDDLATAGAAIEAGEDAGIGSGVDEDIDGREGFKIAGEADVAVGNLDAELFEGVAIELAAVADEVVDSDDGDGRVGFAPESGEGASDEPADSGDEDLHGLALIVRGRGEALPFGSRLNGDLRG